MQFGSDRAKDVFDNKNQTKIGIQNLRGLGEHAQGTPNGHSISPSADPIPFPQARTEPRPENLGMTLSWNSSSENPHSIKDYGTGVGNAS
jgi:hypothetical protein